MSVTLNSPIVSYRIEVGRIGGASWQSLVASNIVKAMQIWLRASANQNL